MMNAFQAFLDKMNKTMVGFFAGLMLPMFMFVLYYAFKFSYLTWDQYIAGARELSVLPSFIKVCVFINLPFFFFFNLFKKFNFCLGIFISSMLYVVAMLVIKFIL